MKKVEGIVRPHLLEAVKNALQEAGAADGLAVGKEIGENEIEFCAGVNADRQAS